jgi:hypothetical protein
LKTFVGLISEDIFFKLTLYFLKILNLNYKNNVYNLVFFDFLWFFFKHKISKNQKNTKLYKIFCNSKSKIQNNQEKNEAKSKNLFKILIFAFEMWELLLFFKYISNIQKIYDFYKQLFQDQDHIKKYICKLY